MSDPNAYQPGPPAQYGQYGQQPGQPQQGGQPHDPRADFINYKFSPEELRVIAECETEAFYNRSLPFSLGLGTFAFLGVKNGVLKPNAKFGPWPKVIGLGLFGYIAGRISYTEKCKEKMLALPNSRFAEMLRRNMNRKDDKRNWSLGTPDAGAATALSLAPFQSAPGLHTDEYNKPNSLNLDTSRPNYSTLDDVYHPTMEGKNDLNEELAIPTRKNTITYDELREKNRQAYAGKHRLDSSNQPYSNQRHISAAEPAPVEPSAPLNIPAGSYSPTLDSERRRNPRFRNDDFDAGNQSTGHKNKYGDILSE